MIRQAAFTLAACTIVACAKPPTDSRRALDFELPPAPSVSPTAEQDAPAVPSSSHEIVVSAVGDCTLGSDSLIETAEGSFQRKIDEVGGDLAYPFSGVASVLEGDDLTIANLEGTLTNEKVRHGKPLAFRGKPEYAGMLVMGGVDVVTTANNHSHDFGFPGYEETLSSLDAAGVGHFGNGGVDRRTIGGVEIVNLGYTGGRIEVRDAVARDVKREKREDNVVIVSFHWGIEGFNETGSVQIALGHTAVDAGADLVLGHHPHVLQGIEEYEGRHIVYSLGNFVFGGNSNPHDKDSMIYQEVFAVDQGKVTARQYRIIPVRISTAQRGNDFRPVLLEGEDRDRVVARVHSFSEALARSSHKARPRTRAARTATSRP
jgi:poly-gamma-glutamate synthesis protein (capsule biosynthesis protein)